MCENIMDMHAMQNTDWIDFENNSQSQQIWMSEIAAIMQSAKTYLPTCVPTEDESAQSGQSLRCPHKETASLTIQNAPRENFDQTARMLRLI